LSDFHYLLSNYSVALTPINPAYSMPVEAAINIYNSWYL